MRTGLEMARPVLQKRWRMTRVLVSHFSWTFPSGKKSSTSGQDISLCKQRVGLLEAKLLGSSAEKELGGVTLRPLLTCYLRGQSSLVCLQGDKPSSNHGLVGCSISHGYRMAMASSYK